VGNGFVIADSGNRRLRQVDGAGTITSVAGVSDPSSVTARLTAGTPCRRPEGFSWPAAAV
jgi:hypothetical protein